LEMLKPSLIDECSAITWLVCAPNTGQQVPSLLFPFDSIQHPFRDVALSDLGYFGIDFSTPKCVGETMAKRLGIDATRSFLEDKAAAVGASVSDILRCAARDSNKTCKESGCRNDAIERNRGYCAAHACYWIPGADRPACALLGPEFMPGRRLCCCRQPTCKSIGYCDSGRFCLPGDATERQAWFDMLGLGIRSTDATNPLNKKNGQHRVAFWHFPPDRRTFNVENGQWTLKGRGEPHQANPTKSFSFLVPSHPICGFVDAERAKRRGEAHPRRSLDATSLPLSGKDTPKRKRSAADDDDDLERALAQQRRAEKAEAALKEIRG